MPTTQDVLDELKALGSEQTRKTIRRHGVAEPLYGVKFGDLEPIKKRIKTDHALALQLWATQVHEARLLATMIADPRQIDADLLEQWVVDLRGHVVADAFAGLVARTPLAQDCVQRWVDADNEWIERTGWHLLGQLALHEPDLPDAYFEPYLVRIEQTIHDAKNRVREAMNNVLIAIGGRNDALEKRALAIAAKIGGVHVDHGPTYCKTPDAAAYILKTRAYREKRAAKATRAAR